jgi:hypothetical protein
MAEKLKVSGGISGRVLNPDGSPRGLVMLILTDAKTGAEVNRMSAEDTGTFFFQKVDPGTYIIKVQGMGKSGSEIPSDQKEIKLSMGRTLTSDVQLLDTTTKDEQPQS